MALKYECNGSQVQMSWISSTNVMDSWISSTNVMDLKYKCHGFMDLKYECHGSQVRSMKAKEEKQNTKLDSSCLGSNEKIYHRLGQESSKKSPTTLRVDNKESFDAKMRCPNPSKS